MPSNHIDENGNEVPFVQEPLKIKNNIGQKVSVNASMRNGSFASSTSCNPNAPRKRGRDYNRVCISDAYIPAITMGIQRLDKSLIVYVPPIANCPRAFSCGFSKGFF